MTHVPVLLQETLDALAVKTGGTYVDGTLGRAGHATEMLRRGAACVIGIDRDDTALAEVAAAHGKDVAAGKLVVRKGRHGELAKIVQAEGIAEVDGILLDLGVSSPQLDDAARGFSFRAVLTNSMSRITSKKTANTPNTITGTRIPGIPWLGSRR